MTTQRSTPRTNARVAAVVVAITVYTFIFFANPPRSWDDSVRNVIKIPRRALNRLVVTGYHAIGVAAPARRLTSGTYLFVAGVVVPWAGMALGRRGRPQAIGFRLPNRLAWRFLAVSFIVSLPFLIWMVGSPSFSRYYAPSLRAGIGGFLAYYLVNMFAEHFFFHGIMLGAFRAVHRWPEPAAIDQSATTRTGRALQWLGLAQPGGMPKPASGGRGHGARILDRAKVCQAWAVQRITRWIGLQDGCLVAICTSAMLFGLVHISKDPRELMLSLPGGFAMAYIAYRTNSWLVPFALHLATAGSACLLMVWGMETV